MTPYDLFLYKKHYGRTENEGIMLSEEQCEANLIELIGTKFSTEYFYKIFLQILNISTK